ncbi:MAG: iron ABC transporter permease, partial [Duodenibacillus sp.]|nr:iron ABC transporter permease [Duodenibacillus sp.]
VLGILLGAPAVTVQFWALAAGLAAAALVCAVSRVRGASPILMLILSGIVVGALFSSLVSLAKFAADPQDVLPSITFWLLGSLSGAKADLLALGLPFVVAGLAVLWLYRWKLNAMALPEDEARSMGIAVRRIRLTVIAAATLITASIVSMCGLIGWVGLLIPHMARMMFGNSNRVVIPASMLLGAIFLLVIDTAARTLTASEIPVSILTAIVGAPVFIVLLRRTGGVRA